MQFSDGEGKKDIFAAGFNPINMHRFIVAGVVLFAWLVLFAACRPLLFRSPLSYYRSVGVEIKKDSIDYAGVIVEGKFPKVDSARLLARLRVRDAIGNVMDCSYGDMLQIALAKSRYIGGNLLHVTEKKQYQNKSRCFRIIGDIYAVPSLEGLEAQIRWHSKRPLLPGDLRGKRPASPLSALPPIAASFTCKTKGDYYKSVILRTETSFWSDSTYLPDDPGQRAFALRRAQLHFDLAEVHVRRLKSTLAGFGRDLSSITGQCRPLTEKQLLEYKQQVQILDAELQSGAQGAVLERWESQVKGELAATEQYFGDYETVLKKPKTR
mgnify:CR=1 FL=1